MKLNKCFTVTTVVLALTALTLTVVLANGGWFTGNAQADFNAHGFDFVVIDVPPDPDVGVPMDPGQFPLGTISGWDVAAIYFDYDSSTDTMYVGIDCFGICGDADGDGDPGHTSAILANMLGTDMPDLLGTETIAMAIDTDNDDLYEEGEPVVGVGSFFLPIPGFPGQLDISTFGTYALTPKDPSTPTIGERFGDALPNTTSLYANPSAAASDIEFSIANFHELPGFTFSPGEAFEFGVKLHAASGLDDGIGEDFVFGEVTSPCYLEVTKTCVVPPSPEPFVCSDAKPIQSLTLIWDGADGINIVTEGDEQFTGIYNGDEVTFSVVGLGNDVDVTISGAVSGASQFHVSCSDQEMNGPEDCGEPQGNGKNNDSILRNDWLLEGMVGENGTLDCTPPDDPGSEECEIVPREADCDTLGKPTSLTFKYTGGSCAASYHSQDPGKATCESSPGPISGQIQVTSANSKYTVTPSTVDPGKEFTVTSSGEFDSNSVFYLDDGTNVETDQIHTSCSQPLEAGDVYGSLTLVGFNGQQAGAEVIYEYIVTNIGCPVSNVTVVDDKLGRIDSFDPTDVLGTGQVVTFTKTVDILVTTTNVVTVTGYLVDDTVCQATDEVTVLVTEPCAECKGGVTELTFQYLGASAADVVVYDKDSADANKILFQGQVQSNGEFTITPRPGQDKLNSDISIYVDGQFHRKVNTSCSQPIGPGAVYGDFLVVAGRSKDNGLMCELNACGPLAAEALEFHDKEVRWEVTNNGDLGLEIKRITIEWPAAANGYLNEIKRDKDKFHDGNFDSPADIASGWEGDANKRTIKPGETDTLKFKFQNDASTLDTDTYKIGVEFVGQDCAIEIEFTPQPEPFVCSDAKPIQSLTLIWNGPNGIGIETEGGEVISGISKGDEVTFSVAGLGNDVDVTISGAVSGASQFHVSCSDQEMNGPEDCGTSQGNGKDNDAGLINAWLLKGMVGENGTLDCTP